MVLFESEVSMVPSGGMKFGLFFEATVLSKENESLFETDYEQETLIQMSIKC